MKYDEDVKRIQKVQQIKVQQMKKKSKSEVDAQCPDDVVSQPIVENPDQGLPPTPPGTNPPDMGIPEKPIDPGYGIPVKPPVGGKPPVGVPPEYGIPEKPTDPGYGIPVQPGKPVQPLPPVGTNPPDPGYGIPVHPLPPGINPPPVQPLPPGVWPPPTQPPVEPEPAPPAYQIGDPNMWQLLEAGVITGGFVSQTKAMYIHSVGCAIRTSVFTENGVTETDIFIPNTKIIDDVNNGKKVVKF